MYAWRMQGPYDAARGLRFDPEKVLLDPFTRAVANWENYNRGAASRGGDNCAQALRSVVVNSNSFDWGDDVYPRIPYAKTIVYEMHVGGLHVMQIQVLHRKNVARSRANRKNSISKRIGNYGR